MRFFDGGEIVQYRSTLLNLQKINFLFILGNFAGNIQKFLEVSVLFFKNKKILVRTTLNAKSFAIIRFINLKLPVVPEGMQKKTTF